MTPTPSASFSLTLRVRIRNVPSAFAEVAQAIGEAGGNLGAIDLVKADPDGTVRDITVAAGDAEHGQRIIDAVRALASVTVDEVSDRTFLIHLGGCTHPLCIGEQELVGVEPVAQHQRYLRSGRENMS